MSARPGPLVWVDGQVLDAQHARVPALDHGLTVGDGVFETLKVSDGAPFALRRHLARLDRSAAGMGLPRVDHALVHQAVADLLGARHLPLGRLRITWTAGDGPLGSDRPVGAGRLVLAADLAAPPSAAARAVRAPWPRNERAATAGLKTTSYAENVLALAYARRHGADEALLGNTVGELCEGTGSNVLVEVDGALVTPPLSSGALAGVTRALLLQWAGQEGVRVVEGTLPLSVLDSTPTVLLTSSLRDVQPLAAVDGRVLRPGELARAAVELFARRSRQDRDPG